MDLPAINLSLQRLRSNHLTLILGVCGIAVAYTLSGYIVQNRILDLLLIALVCGYSLLIIISFKKWRTGLKIFLAWLLFEDLVRKYLGNNMAIYFGKDILAAVFYLSFFIALRGEKIRRFQPPFLIPLLLMIWFGAIQVFNPGSPSIFFGLMGFKLFFFYVPLMLVGYSLFDSEDDLRGFFFLNSILILIIASLGVAQSIIGPTFLNPTVLQEDIRELATLYRMSPVTGLISYRPTSVFVSSGRYVNFLMVGWLLVLGFTGYVLFRRRQGRMLAFIVAIVTAAAVVLSASRGSFMWALINTLVFSIAFLWGAPRRQHEAAQVFRAIRRVALSIALAIFLLSVAYPDALLSRLALYQETLIPNSPTSELTDRGWDYPTQSFLHAFTYDRWPYGYGIGTTGLGGQYVARFFRVKPMVAGVESGFGTLVVEMGFGGLILWLMMGTSILLSAWKVVKKLRGSPWFPLAFVIFWYAFFLLFPATYGGMPAYEDFVLNAYFWLLLGLLFRLPDLALSEKVVNIIATPDEGMNHRSLGR